MFIIDRYGGAAGAIEDAMSGADCTLQLERALGEKYGTAVAAVCSADAAIHTALHLCGVQHGDLVFVPTYTFYSYVSTVVHAGGVPVFIDCEPSTRCMSPAALSIALLWAELSGREVKAVVVDNAFGAVADYNVLYPLAKSHNVPMIELCCDCFCGEFNGEPVGTNGDFGIVSFGKGVLGGGAALICGECAEQAKRFTRAMYSVAPSHDYRLHPFVAALDLSSLDIIPKLATRAKKNYQALCESSEYVVPPTAGDGASYAPIKPTVNVNELRRAGFTVKLPPPVHTLPQYENYIFFEHEQGYCAAKAAAQNSLVSLDFSVFSRFRLINILKDSAHGVS